MAMLRYLGISSRTAISIETRVGFQPRAISRQSMTASPAINAAYARWPSSASSGAICSITTLSNMTAPGIEQPATPGRTDGPGGRQGSRRVAQPIPAKTHRRPQANATTRAGAANNIRPHGETRSRAQALARLPQSTPRSGTVSAQSHDGSSVVCAKKRASRTVFLANAPSR